MRKHFYHAILLAVFVHQMFVLGPGSLVLSFVVAPIAAIAWMAGREFGKGE